MKTLCLDFGNTRMKAALFDNDQLMKIIELGDDVTADIQSIFEEYGPQRSILSSVVNHDANVEALLQAKTAFHRLTNVSKLPVTIPVGKPETMGADRLAIAAAATFIFPS